jgi:hypothetical protein
MSESEFQSQVIELAQLFRWRVAHFRPGLTQSGRWCTAVQADGAGFPDLVLVRDGVLLFAELKSEKGRLSESQIEWIGELGNVQAIRVYLWRPSDWKAIEEVLR